ncbi:hypothetical protein [Hydrococcus rivularis]|nr:hypothetical protein [Hydrococcus rivularis]
MLEYYLHRSGQISTAIHPFVKGATPSKSNQQVKSRPEQLLRGIHNLVLSGFSAIARLIRSDRLQRMNRSD